MYERLKTKINRIDCIFLCECAIKCFSSALLDLIAIKILLFKFSKLTN